MEIPGDRFPLYCGQPERKIKRKKKKNKQPMDCWAFEPLMQSLFDSTPSSFFPFFFFFQCETVMWTRSCTFFHAWAPNCCKDSDRRSVRNQGHLICKARDFSPQTLIISALNITKLQAACSHCLRLQTCADRRWRRTVKQLKRRHL